MSSRRPRLVHILVPADPQLPDVLLLRGNWHGSNPVRGPTCLALRGSNDLHRALGFDGSLTRKGKSREMAVR
jgi:hypothetical protein